MHNVRKVTRDMFWVGGSDRRLALFENAFPIENGVSYNSYVVLDEKTVLLDTVDKAISEVFFENVRHVLDRRTLDYVIVNHMEPDHAATLGELVLRYPDVKIIGNSKTLKLIEQFFDFDIKSRFISVSEGDELSTGRHTFTFVMAPMVHWPETMVTYDKTDGILYSADAFGTFGALNGNIFADEVNFEQEWLIDARRYYANIVGKYGKQVVSLLKKAGTIDIKMICPLHGPIWRENIGWFIDKYMHWATYTPEEQAVVIAVGSIYGHTEQAAEILASELAQKGIKNIKIYDTSKTHPSYIVAEAFRASHLVFASSTYNAGIFVNMENLIHDLCAHALQNRTVAVIDNGSWAASAGKLIIKSLVELKDMTFMENAVSLKSGITKENVEELKALADEIYQSIHEKKEKEDMSTKNPMFNISYGLFVLSAKEGDKDNGCIINTVMQITDNPKRIVIGVNKANYTHDMIMKSRKFNVSILSQSAKFDTFKCFGFRSGKDANKFADRPDAKRSENGLLYLTQETNAYICATVETTIDCGTHTMFVAAVDAGEVLNDEPSVTYTYYQENIKPKPQVAPADKKVKGFVCKICGYVYEGEVLPPDFVCPLCKHGAEDFEPIQ